MIRYFYLIIPFVLSTACVRASVVPGPSKKDDASLLPSPHSLRVDEDGMRRRRRTVVGGVTADPDRFPYYVRLEEDGEFICGASLIHPDFVLTAAHCVIEDPSFPLLKNRLDAIVGGYDYQSGVRRQVEKIFTYVAYDDWVSVSNDIALVKIYPPMDNATFLNYTNNRTWLQNGDSVTGIGLGQTDGNDEDSFPDQLQQVQIQIVDEIDCDDRYDGDIHRKSMLCAIGVGKDTCNGDSGGPLIVMGDDPGQDVQVGIVSWGDVCGDVSLPGVYADVAYFAPWIDSILCQHSDEPPEGCMVRMDTAIEPIYLDPTIDTCRDFAGAFYTDWWHQFQRCDWLREKARITLYCTESQEAWVTCPLTCHACTYETDDDYYSDLNDDTTYYDEASSPALVISFIVVTLFLCCLLCIQGGYCGCCRDKCRKKSPQLNPPPSEYPKNPSEMTEAEDGTSAVQNPAQTTKTSDIFDEEGASRTKSDSST